MGLRLNNGVGCVAFLAFLGILVGLGLVAARVTHSPLWAFLAPVAVIVVILGSAGLPLKQRKVTPEEFADELERHLVGMESDGDWDQTSSVRIFDPLLEEVRQSLSDRFDSLSNPEVREELRHIIEALRRGEFPIAAAGNANKRDALGSRLGP
jgi:hypothetical protein